MKTLAALVVVAAVACTPSSSTPAPAPAPAPAPSSAGGQPSAPAGGCSTVTVYDDNDLHGASLSLAAGRYDVDHFESSPVRNDTIRSVCVPAGCTLVLYADGGFAGDAHTYTATTNDLGDFAGSASSAVVTCR